MYSRMWEKQSVHGTKDQAIRSLELVVREELVLLARMDHTYERVIVEVAVPPMAEWDSDQTFGDTTVSPSAMPAMKTVSLADCE